MESEMQSRSVSKKMDRTHLRRDCSRLILAYLCAVVRACGNVGGDGILRPQ